MKLIKFFLPALVQLGLILTIQAQITIVQSDMPSTGDTVRTSITFDHQGYDFSITGEAHSWDFTALRPEAQKLDTFKTLLQTPIVFYFAFMGVADMAVSYNLGDLMPELSIDHAYQFLQKNSNAFSDYGYGLIVQDLPVPLRFSNPDIIYSFPMTYGNEFSSIADLEFSLPDVAFISIDRARETVVDGWGTVQTPYGSFETIRLKSSIIELDSAYIDSIGQGFQIKRNYTEYKWMAKSHRIPILSVIEDPLLGTVITYKDSIRDLTVDIRKIYQPFTGIIYPNPFSSELWISQIEDTGFPLEIQLINAEGRLMYQEKIQENTEEKIRIRIPDNLSNGLYYVRLNSNNKRQLIKLLRYK
ncbi:MAG: T9SS type A sorting domain-containing protein [Bacteroidales bacterium]|nr:T9SS type A sorting domain-containing protein [Bacteroidales bacterium]